MTFRLLGGSELLLDRAPVAVDTRKAVALLAYLVVESSASRDTLSTLFWPESTETRARSTLRRTLSTARSALGQEVIDADRATVTLNSEVRSDVDSFRKTLAETATHGHEPHDVCAACVPLLEEATAAYRGDFLAGFSLRDAPEFDDWSRTVAAALRNDVAHALERLATGKASVGDYRGAVDSAQRWIDVDPLREPAHRNLMLLNAWAGDRPASIAAYRHCVSILNEELGVAPVGETTELHEAILDDDLPPPPSVRRRVKPREAPAAAQAAPMLDRRRELELLRRELMWAATGGRTVIVSGDTWMGKTRLLDEFAVGVRRQGQVTVAARGYRAERSVAYGLASQLLRNAVQEGNVEPGDVPSWVRQEVAKLIPEFADTPAPFDDFGETRLFEAATTLLLAAGRRGTLVVLIDDGQWIDEASVSLLSYLNHRIADAAVLVVVAMRPMDEPTTDRDVAAAFPAVSTTELLLSPLTPGDIEDVVETRKAAIDAIERTGGVPLLVAELLDAHDRTETSSNVQKYVDSRLAALDDVSSQIIGAAAVLGSRCDLGLLRATSGRSEDEVVDAVDDLIRRRLLRGSTEGAGIDFALDATADAAYGNLTPVRRRLLHGRAAESLEASRGSRSDSGAPAAIAAHLRNAGRDDDASAWFVKAGLAARSVYAHSEAIEALQAAIALGSRHDAEIYQGLGESMLTDARFDEAITAFESAAAVGTPGQVAVAEHGVGEVHRRLGRFGYAETHFGLAEADHPEPASLYSDWAMLEFRQGDSGAASELAVRAVEAAEASGRPTVEARARGILGVVSDDVVQLERAVELAGADPVVRLGAINGLAYAAANDGDLERAHLLIAEGIDLAERVGDRHRMAALLNHAADIHHRAGREQESQEALTEAVRMFAGVQPDAWAPEVWLLSRW
ncbi:MAG: BTAD domain-containing putative transcriptional regulator [Acidimicrobiia bacterium]